MAACSAAALIGLLFVAIAVGTGFSPTGIVVYGELLIPEVFCVSQSCYSTRTPT